MRTVTRPAVFSGVACLSRVVEGLPSRRPSLVTRPAVAVGGTARRTILHTCLHSCSIPLCIQLQVEVVMETDVIQDKELGRELARVRALAGLTQAQLAARLGVSQTVVSRTESGERRLESTELHAISEAIGIGASRSIETRRSREWKELPRPPLGHPDHDLIWKAEMALRDLQTLRDRPDIAYAFAQRIEVLREEIEAAVANLLTRRCRVVFIGRIGVGKTSAICHIADLVVTGPSSRRLSPVLDVGSGRTTLCEVHVNTGPTRITIDPSPDEEIRAHVADFADKILGAARGDREKAAAQDGQIMSREVERVIRNMADLTRRRLTDKDQPRDPARVLARQVIAEEQGRGKTDQDVASRLQYEVLTRIRGGKRQRRELRWDESTGADPYQWLQSEFHRINYGLNPEFTIPKRIYVSVGRPLITDIEDVEVRIVDTKGIDETVARADLENHMGASHTVLVLCSGFNEAPGQKATDLLRRAKEAGIEGEGLHGVVLGLPKYDEALQMQDDEGEAVDTIEEGYRLKTSLVEETVHQSLGFKDFSVKFFNSYEDNPTDIRRDLSERIGLLFDGYRGTVNDLVRSAGQLVENYEDEQIQEIVRQATTWVRSWINRYMDVSAVEHEAQDSLLDAVKDAHPATINATMRRKGGWYNLDYGHQLAYGARLIVSSVLRARVQSFGDHCDTFLEHAEHEPAHVLLSQIRRAMERASQDGAERARLLAETWFHHRLREDGKFWTSGMDRWGRGAGYRSDIVDMNEKWFSENGQLNEKVRALIKREWKRAMKGVVSMLEAD